tara:strand:+ start:441 stop:1322 length:882 start_codon:yes stop_codon:yes gene_type:complete
LQFEDKIMPKDGEDRWFDENAKLAGFGSEPSDAMANKRSKKLYIDFYHTPSRNSIAFKAFITEYSETYEVNYEEQEAFGRIDAFAKYKSTRRRVSLGWETVAASFEEAQVNMLRCTELIQMMYPSYQNFKTSTDITFTSDNPVIASEPLFRVRFANWLVDPSIGSDSGPGAFTPAEFGGVWCRITNFQYSPDLEKGSFDTATGVYPKVIKLSCAIIPYMPEGFWNDLDHEKTKDFEYFPFGHRGMDVIPSVGPPEGASENNEAQDQATEASTTNSGGVWNPKARGGKGGWQSN